MNAQSGRNGHRYCIGLGLGEQSAMLRVAVMDQHVVKNLRVRVNADQQPRAP